MPAIEAYQSNLRPKCFVETGAPLALTCHMRAAEGGKTAIEARGCHKLESI